jgi:outer membrane protein OmpA-like peptidoglycan-associated protein
MINRILLSLVFLLAACAPPKPQTVNGSNKQPINTPETAETIALRAKLAQTEAKLREEQARPVVEIPPVVVQPVPPPAPPAPPAPQMVRYHFPVNGTKIEISPDESEHLLELLKTARRIEVRGRTDGQHPSAADEKIALERALAAKRYLVGQGVSPAIISLNYLSAGDFIADNFSNDGKSENRRVDIEIYQ